MNQFTRLDKTVFSITTLTEQDEDDKAYWRSKTPHERLEAIELMRQINYDYDLATARIERVLEVIERALR